MARIKSKRGGGAKKRSSGKSKYGGYTGPTPWKKWKKGQRWSLEPTAAEVDYYRKTIAAAPGRILSRDEIEEGAIEAAQLARIDMAPRGSGDFDDWKTTGRYINKMNRLYKKRMANQQKRRSRRGGISRAELDRLEASFKRGSKKRGGKKIRAGGAKRSTVKAVAPKKLRSKQPLFDKSFVLTGTLHATRAQVTKWIEQAGGKVQSAVRATTTYLVKGAEPGEAKLSAAKKHKVPIITEGRLQKMMHSVW